MHFNWFFSAKANFKVCIEAQKNSVAIFFHVNPYYYISTSVLNDILRTVCLKSSNQKTPNNNHTSIMS